MSQQHPQRTEMHPNAPQSTRTHQNGPRAARSSADDRSECTQMHPGAPECTPEKRGGKTNPPPPPSLSLAQHAAIRHLVRGYRVGQVARHLGVSRHTIKRWKHDPRFVAELERLRREMNAAIVSPAAAASPPPRRRDPLASWIEAMQHAEPQHFNDDDDDDGDEEDLDDPADEMSDAEAADMEQWVNDVIRAKHAGAEIPPPPAPRTSL